MDKYIGKLLDNRYEILEVIGVGGMAMVYRARCHRLNRFVAVKILKDDYLQDADFRRRFHAESQAVAMLSHPNIVAVYDVSRNSELEYIVMELIDGITLKQYVQKKGSLNWRESLHFTTQFVKALSHAHSRGIIHRDIKPHNIMILRDGSVKVADFGIARLTATQNSLTQEALGSVHYISPEQARGSHIDARSDIYSCGVVLYEMLTGRLPFQGESPIAIAIQHINSMPLTPREINPDIPPALEAITMKAMSANISKRYSSMDAMLHDLEEFRKNPSINFDYDVNDLSMPADSDEPTKKIGTANGEKKHKKTPEERKADYEYKSKNNRLALMTGILSVMFFVIGMLYLVLTLFKIGGDNDNITEVVVPDFIGEYADSVMNSGEYINFEFNPEWNNAMQDRGYIYNQKPRPGDTMKSTEPITLYISNGPTTIPLPDFENKDYRVVQSELIKLKLSYKSTIIYEFSETIQKDYVIRTDPPAHLDVTEGTPVQLYVSKGRETKMVTVPNLYEYQQLEAVRVIDQEGLVLGEIFTEENDLPAGLVCGQSLEADTSVEAKTPIDIWLSLGPSVPVDTSPSPSPSISPTPEPTTETTEPPEVTEPPSSLVSAIVKVPLPREADTVRVEIQQNSVTVFNDVVNTLLGVYEHEVTGQPEDIISVFIDGEQKGEPMAISSLP